MTDRLTVASTVVATTEQVSCDLAGEAAILHLKSGVYYGLDAVGAHIWNLIQEPKTVAEVRDELLAEYEVEPEKCEVDLLAVLEEMVERDLIVVNPA